MCLCTGTPAPDLPAAPEKRAAGRRHERAIYLALVAALAVNLTVSLVWLGS